MSAVSGQLLAAQREGAAAFHVVLTPDPCVSGLEARFAQLKQCWRRIQDKSAWRRAISDHGVVTGFEVSIGAGEGHPHLHLMLWSLDRLQVKKLADFIVAWWLEMNPGSMETAQRIEAVADTPEDFQDVLAYVSKGTVLTTAWPSQLLGEAVHLLTGGARCFTRAGLAKGDSIQKIAKLRAQRRTREAGR